MNEFQQARKIGRDKFEKLMSLKKIDSFELTSGTRTPYDADLINKNNEHFLVKVKVRDTGINDYPNFILEKKLYDQLIGSVKKCRGVEGAYYVNFFKDDFFAIWNLNDVKAPKASTKNCKRFTVIDKGNENKQVILLDVLDAISLGVIHNNKLILV